METLNQNDIKRSKNVPLSRPGFQFSALLLFILSRHECGKMPRPYLNLPITMTKHTSSP